MLCNRKIAFVISCAMLASCGGGSSNGPTAGTPTPSPTATPTPTPTPTPTYQTYSQLTGTQTFQTACSGTESGSPFAVFPFGQGTTITSDRGPPTYEIMAANAFSFGTFTTSFTQADRTTSTTSESYSKVNGNGFTERFTTFAPQVNAAALEYVRFGQAIGQLPSSSASIFCVFGVPTQLNDRPAATKTYSNASFRGSITIVENLGAGPTRFYSISRSTATISADPVTGNITISLDIKGREIVGGMPTDPVVDLGVFTATDSIDGTVQSYDGNIVDATNTVAGTFGGWFFGPQGTELGMALSLNQRRVDGSDLQVAGVVFAK